MAAFAIPTSAESDDTTSNGETLVPADARYTMTISSITMRDTFRLDRYTGRVDRLVRSSDDGLLWEEMIVRDRPKSLDESQKPRFHIFLSGIAAKGAYLIDTKTGKTWRLLSVLRDPKLPDTEFNRRTVWSPMEESPLD